MSVAHLQIFTFIGSSEHMRWCSFLLIAQLLIACRSAREAVTIHRVDYAQLVTILDSFDFTISPVSVSQTDSAATSTNWPSVQPMRVYGRRVSRQQATISAIDTTQLRKSAAPTLRQDTTRNTSYNLFAVIIISAIVATAVAILLRKLFFSRNLMF